MNAAEFKEKYVGDEDDCYEVGGEGCKKVDSEEVINGKCVHYSEFFAVDDQFFCVEVTRSNDGYWGDSEFLGVEVYEVESIVKTINAWKAI